MLLESQSQINNLMISLADALIDSWDPNAPKYSVSTSGHSHSCEIQQDLENYRYDLFNALMGTIEFYGIHRVQNKSPLLLACNIITTRTEETGKNVIL